MKVELEIWGGGTAAYLSKFRKRHFTSAAEAAAYMDLVAAHLSALGVSAAHPMAVYDTAGRDVTHLCRATDQYED
jgi:hypothetical protein